LEPADTLNRRVRFEGYELNLQTGELCPNGSPPLSLADQPFRILVMLVSRPGELVTREEIRNALWPDGTVVEFEHSISAAMKRLRQVLGDSVEQPRYIETLPRRGFRWKPPVEWIGNSSARLAPSESSSMEIPQQRPRRRAFLFGTAAALLVLTVVFWFLKNWPSFSHPMPAPKLKQLTMNSFENRVLSGAISPDGKYLAYSDAKGMRVQLVATGETRVVPQPEELGGKEVNWEVVGTWFPDSSRFVVNSHPMLEDTGEWSSRSSSVWLVSVLSGPPHKLRENAVAYSISPDGSSVAFGANIGRLGDREIWLMDPDGAHARKIFDTDEASAIDGLLWSRDGKRALLHKTDQSGVTLLSRDLVDGAPITVLGSTEMSRVRAVLWRADGRLLYSAEEPGSYIGGACNLWEMRLDPKTGSPVEKPRKLTNWTGFCMGALSESSDGRRLTFLKWSGKQTSFLAELEGGNHILHLRHFPLSESSEGVVGWTLDSKEIIFMSTRSGHGIYRQSLDRDIAEPVLSQGLDRDPRVAPDGKSILYLAPGKSGGWPAEEPQPVMRISLSGGQPQPLFTAAAGSLLSCARSPADLCVIAEPSEKGDELVISPIDQQKGRGHELFRFPLDTTTGTWCYDISPDGTRLAVTPTAAGSIYILSLKGKILQQIHVRGSNNLESFNWTADGNGLYVTAHTANGREILHVDLSGNARLLWENTGGSGETLATPSPDGHYLSFNGWTMSGNMWVMENF
jgi:DNA-binding winged helix-turn-helix (wHTH) protein/Tol biopolymer transport system component